MTENILHSPALYRYIVITAEAVLSEFMDEEQAAEAARRTATKFCEDHVGMTYRVPALSRAEKIARNEQIREQVRTMSIEQVARVHGITVKYVRAILRQEDE